MAEKHCKQEIYRGHERIKVSHKFILALALVSILGFIGIVSETLFNYNIDMYIESAWMMILGVGLIVETNVKKIKEIKEDGLNSGNFTHLVTIIIGVMAVLAGILSLPQIDFSNSSFLAIKGIISIIAIVIIIIQTWVID